MTFRSRALSAMRSDEPGAVAWIGHIPIPERNVLPGPLEIEVERSRSQLAGLADFLEP
jgi:hypothetical protein